MKSRFIDVARRARTEGTRKVVQRTVRRAYLKVQADSLDFPLLPGDLSDSAATPPRAVPDLVSGRPLRIGWLTTPPSAGSGGHTTMFRMIRGLEQSGHTCSVLLYDRHGGNIAEQARVIRDSWPWVRADVVRVDEGLPQVDACVATAWETAHVLAQRDAAVHRFYFVQDYEPFFYPHGSMAELAADTYRFGFTTIALGKMVSERLRSEIGIRSHFAPFSCDTEVYGLRNRGLRSGIAFYTKPDNSRRGYILGIRALELFHRRHPEQPIHLYGQPVNGLDFPVIQHGRLEPEDLNSLYNQCVAGLAMSFTNISLVAEEMLAAGCLPVVNRSADALADLDNPHVVWAKATPSAIADRLCDVIETEGTDRAVAAASSVRTDNWTLASGAVNALIEKIVTGADDSA